MPPPDWYTSATPNGQPPVADMRMAAAYELRPLSTGEVLDRTFAVYRGQFWLFAGISAISGAVQLIGDALNLAVHHWVLTSLGFRAALLETQIGSGVVLLVFALATAVTEAATVYALGRIYLGQASTVAESLRATIGRWYRYAGIALWQGWSALWLGLLIALPAVLILVFRRGTSYWLSASLLFLAIVGGAAYGVIAYLRNALAVPASVIEGLTLRASMRRSKVLSVGAKGRAFVVLLITVCLFWVAGIIQAPMLFFIARSPLQEHVLAEMTVLGVSFAAHTLVAPVALIGLSLVYFDQRVRKEGLDLLMLLGSGSRTPEWVAPASSATPEPAWQPGYS